MAMQIHVPGNYPSDYWIEDMNNRDLLLPKTKTFLLIDIHNYSKLCGKLESNPRLLSAFIRNFFLRAEGNFGKLIQKVWMNKYIGDAIFCSFSPDITVQLVDVCQDLLSDFVIENHEISKRAGVKLSLSIVLDKCNCITGGVGSNLYYDYSYWGNDINQFFGMTKRDELKEGYIWIGRELLNSLPLKDRKMILANHLFMPKEVLCGERIKNFFGILVEN